MKQFPHENFGAVGVNLFEARCKQQLINSEITSYIDVNRCGLNIVFVAVSARQNVNRLPWCLCLLGANIVAISVIVRNFY